MITLVTITVLGDDNTSDGSDIADDDAEDDHKSKRTITNTSERP